MRSPRECIEAGVHGHVKGPLVEQMAVESVVAALTEDGWTFERAAAFAPHTSGPSVHHDGSDTERDAAELVAPRLASQKRAVLVGMIHVELVRGITGATADELDSRLDLPEYAARRRVNDLKNEGWLIDSGHRRSHNGKRAIVWTLSPAARSWLDHNNL